MLFLFYSSKTGNEGSIISIFASESYIINGRTRRVCTCQLVFRKTLKIRESYVSVSKICESYVSGVCLIISAGASSDGSHSPPPLKFESLIFIAESTVASRRRMLSVTAV